MTRYMSTLMIGLIAAAVSFANQDKQDQPAKQTGDFSMRMMECAKTCAACQVQCDACFKHCLSLTGETQKEHEKTAQLCADCAECCKACATLCARQSVLSRHMLECCEKCCKQCATACEKYESDKHMAACAKACRDCEKECAELLKEMGK